MTTTLAFDGNHRILMTKELRKIVSDIANETNFSGKFEIEVETPDRKYVKMRKSK